MRVNVAFMFLAYKQEILPSKFQLSTIKLLIKN